MRGGVGGGGGGCCTSAFCCIQVLRLTPFSLMAQIGTGADNDDVTTNLHDVDRRRAECSGLSQGITSAPPAVDAVAIIVPLSVLPRVSRTGS